MAKSFAAATNRAREMEASELRPFIPAPSPHAYRNAFRFKPQSARVAAGQSVDAAAGAEAPLGVLNPCEQAYGQHLEILSDGAIRGLTAENARVYSVSGYLVIYDPTLSPLHILRVVSRGSWCPRLGPSLSPPEAGLLDRGGETAVHVAGADSRGARPADSVTAVRRRGMKAEGADSWDLPLAPPAWPVMGLLPGSPGRQR
jgi:hypothetical protein